MPKPIFKIKEKIKLKRKKIQNSHYPNSSFEVFSDGNLKKSG